MRSFEQIPSTVFSPLTWVEVSRSALIHNVQQLLGRAHQGEVRPLSCVMVKGNAYGHGLVQSSRVFLEAGVDWLGIADLQEAVELRQAGISAPLYAVCHIPPHQVDAALQLGVRLTVYDEAVVEAAARAAQARRQTCYLHIKLETGTNRQGLRLPAAMALAKRIVSHPMLRLEGLCTHFADIEDTTDHRFAQSQLARFLEGVQGAKGVLEEAGQDPDALIAHASNSAAVLLWSEVALDLVRFGVGAYGLWPSKETFLSAQQLGQRPVPLRPALTWKTTIAQVRQVPLGEWVGYGRTFRAVRPTRVAILPVGYYDGYDRRLSNRGQVLVCGQRAPVIGRVAMNMIAVDVTDNPGAQQGSEVVLLGAQRNADGDTETVSADEVANWMGTIHYEVVTRINDRIHRALVDENGAEEGRSPSI